MLKTFARIRDILYLLLVAAVVAMVAIGILSLGFFAVYGFYLVMIVIPFATSFRLIELVIYYRSRARLSPEVARKSRLTILDLSVFAIAIMVLSLAVQDPGLYPRMFADIPEFLSMVEF